MRIVITGGTGFIGRALAVRLVALGHEVTVASRSRERSASLFGGMVRGLAWDGVAPGPLAACLDAGQEEAVVVNLAGENIASGRWTSEKRRLILDSRVRAGRAVAEAAGLAERPPAALVQGSAVGFYGARASAGGRLVTERTPRGEGFLAEVCEQWEASVASVADLGVRLAVARTGVVLGPGGGMLARLAAPFRAFAGGPPGGGGQWVPWVHLDDEVGALAWLAENSAASGAYNICAPEAATMRALCAALGRALGRPSWLPVPAALLRLALGRAMAEETVLASQRAVPERLLAEGYAFERPRLDDALSAALKD